MAEHAPIPAELELSGREIIDAAVKVHKAMGPRLLESVHETCMVHELTTRGLRVQRQLEVPIECDGLKLASGLRLDMLVEGAVVVELKAVERLEAVHQAQLLSCLRLTRVRLGYLTNFTVPLLRDGIRRIVC